MWIGIDTIRKSNKTYSAPIRIVAQDGATSNLTVNNATFTYTGVNKSCNGDILLGDGQASAAGTQGKTTLAITGTNANVSVQQKGHYDANGDVTNPEKGQIEVNESDNITINVTNGEYYK